MDQFDEGSYQFLKNVIWQGVAAPQALDMKKQLSVRHERVPFNPSQNGCVSVALCLAGASAKVQPAIQPVNNGQPILFSYSLNVPPRK